MDHSKTLAIVRLSPDKFKEKFDELDETAQYQVELHLTKVIKDNFSKEHLEYRGKPKNVYQLQVTNYDWGQTQLIEAETNAYINYFQFLLTAIEKVLAATRFATPGFADSQQKLMSFYRKMIKNYVEELVINRSQSGESSGGFFSMTWLIEFLENLNPTMRLCFILVITTGILTLAAAFDAKPAGDYVISMISKSIGGHESADTDEKAPSLLSIGTKILLSQAQSNQSSGRKAIEPNHCDNSVKGSYTRVNESKPEIINTDPGEILYDED
jgi:hypothetical protein